MPGEKALEALKQLDKEMSVFKTPNIIGVRKKKSRVKVLDEDAYIEEMAKIIQRDFFPDLEKLQAQNEFLDATDRKDTQKLRELFIKYSSGHRPPTERYASPATFETPSSQASFTPRIDDFASSSALNVNRDISKRSNNSKEEKKPSISSKHSLDSYLATHTSEDNQSFQKLMEEVGRRCLIKFADQLKEEEDSQLKRLTGCTVPSIEEQADQTKHDDLETWSYRAKNFIMYVPDGHVSKGDSRPKQEVVHSNTRMDKDPFDHQRSKEAISQIAKNQERILSGRIDVDGCTLLEAKKKEMLGQGATSLNSNCENEGGNDLSAYVRTPSPCPGAPGESPMMTWGEIEGTPFRLDGGDTPLPHKSAGAAFKIASIPKREQLALALAEKAGQRHRDMKQKAMEAAKRSMLSPSPRMATGSVTDRLASMSPAAQRLATHHLKRPVIGASPSPKIYPGRTPKLLTPSSARSNRKTPIVVSGVSIRGATPNTAKRKINESSSDFNGSEEVDRRKNCLTDDLLQINLPKRRLKASDFFKPS